MNRRSSRARSPLGAAGVVRGNAAAAGEFCWVDLAAADLAVAKRFYTAVFGWSAHEQNANGGRFMRWQSGDRAVGSMYPLSVAQRVHDVPSHWTPYVRVDDVDVAAQRVAQCGGAVLVRPFVVDGVARIALVLDAVGAQLGLWQPLPAATMA
jgi:predicted enzyme related to lactoylglutathione lyase